MAEFRNAFEMFNQELKILKFEISNDNKILRDVVKKGIFKSITVDKIVTKKGNMISLRGLCYYLTNYAKTMCDARERFERNIKKKKRIEFSVKVESTDSKKPYIFLREDSRFSYDGTKRYEYIYEPEIKIECLDIPKLVYGKIELYNVIKKDIYEFLNYFCPYVDYLNKLPKNIHIGESTIVRIEDSNLLVDDTVSITVNFGNFALFEIHIKNGKIDIVIFSNDNKISKYLEGNKNKLLDEIFIPESEIRDILEIIM